MPRLFFGVPVPPATRATLEAVRSAWCVADPSWLSEKWVAPPNLHLTLQFVGEVPARHVEGLLASAREALRAGRAFDFVVDILAVVPPRRRASMLWAVPRDGSPGSASVAAQLRGCLPEHLAAPSERPFSAHVTLCRARRPHLVSSAAREIGATVLASAELRSRSMSVSAVTLYESRLSPSGPAYTPLEEIPLGG